MGNFQPVFDIYNICHQCVYQAKLCKHNLFYLFAYLLFVFCCCFSTWYVISTWDVILRLAVSVSCKTLFSLFFPALVLGDLSVIDVKSASSETIWKS